MFMLIGSFSLLDSLFLLVRSRVCSTDVGSAAGFPSVDLVADVPLSLRSLLRVAWGGCRTGAVAVFRYSSHSVSGGGVGGVGPGAAAIIACGTRCRPLVVPSLSSLLAVWRCGVRARGGRRPWA